MQRLDVTALPPTSAGAAVALSSGTQPDFLVRANNGIGLIAARWRRRLHVQLSEPLRLDDHVLSYCASGRTETTLVIDGVPVHLRQRLGSIAFVPAQRAVQWTMDSEGESVHVHLYIPRDSISVPERIGADGKPQQAVVSLRDPWIESYFRLMLAEVESCAHDARLEASPFLDETGTMLIRHLDTLLSQHPASAENPPDSAAHVTPLRPFIVRRIEDFVKSRLNGDIRLESLAEIASMSVGHFLRSFHKATGATPHQYVLRRRLDRACELLHGSTDQVSTIALRCGFSSAAHFSAIFHLHRGCTPSQYRRAK